MVNGMSEQDSGYRKIDELITSLFENIDASRMKDCAALFKGWNDIVSTICTDKTKQDKIGLKLAAHSHVIDLKNGTLLVETDHSAYIQMLQMYKTYILRGLNTRYPQLEIRNLSFRLKGSNYKLHDVSKTDEKPKQVQQKSEEKQNTQEYVVDKELPPELKEVFDRLKPLC